MHILVLYHHLQPIPSPERDQLYAFRRHSTGRVAHINLGRGEPSPEVLRARWDLIVFDGSLFELRFQDGEFERALSRLDPFAQVEATRVALPRNSASDTERLVSSLRRLRVDCVVSAVSPEVAEVLYRSLVQEGVRLLERQGAYLDERTVNRLEFPGSDLTRLNDLALAPDSPQPWLGLSGVREFVTVEAVQRRALERGVLRCDRAPGARSNFAGDSWWRFLLASRYFVSAAAGFDQLDPGGTLRREASSLPDLAPLDLARRLSGEGANLAASALRPSHLEACAARTCLVLVSGDYGGVLQSGRHYLELQPDLSNLDEVLEVVLSDVERKRITDCAYAELVGSNLNSYRNLVELVEHGSGARDASGRGGSGSPPTKALLLELRARDAWSWSRLEGVAALAAAPRKALRRTQASGRLIGHALGALKRLGKIPPRAKTPGPLRVVTLTPLPVERDSRTFKQAASVSRLGYHSQLFEGKRSSLREEELLFELRMLRSSRSPGVRSPLLPRGLYDALHASRAPQRLVRQVAAIYRAYAAQYLWPALESLPDADLYYMHSPYFFPAVYWKCRQNGARYVYDAHDFYGRMQHRSSQIPTIRYFILPFFDLLERCSVKFAAEVVTVSQGVALLQEEAFQRPFTLLRNVQDARLEVEPAEDIRARLGLSEEDFLLVVVGNAKAGQAVEQTLEALRQLPENVHVAFLGAGHESRAELIRRLGLEGRVHLCGPVKPFEVVPHIRTANAGLVIYFGLSENYVHCLPNGFFQCISAGLPVLYPRLPEMERLAERYGFGLAIDPQDPASTAAAIRELLTNEEAYAGLQKRALAAAHELSWEREEEILRRLLAEALS
ncbi:MAG: glycosyltransferase [Planctomycetes bacterium]|nr:glycosyltransferase [Planctomycetota bacterium]